MLYKTSKFAKATLAKICGTTSVSDAKMVQRLGADFLGLIIEHAPSPRSVSREKAREIAAATNLPTVAVTVNQSLSQLLQVWEELSPAVLQLHGDETPELVSQLKSRGLTVWTACSGNGDALLQRAREMQNVGADAILIDARAHSGTQVIYGGSGHISDWDAARVLAKEGARVVLAGGLNPQNVQAAIEAAGPWMVDCVSGVEKTKGEKDESKVRDFLLAMRGA